MKTVTITPAGAIILSARHRIPDLAKATLSAYANNRFKQLNYVTKAFKYEFPFYEQTQRRRSFTKFFTILKKTIERNIPYLTESNIEFISIPREGAESIYVRLGPLNINRRMASTDKKAAMLQRYLLRVSTHLRKSAIPLMLRWEWVTHIKPGALRYHADPVEQEKNTYEILEISIRFLTTVGETGYLLLTYAPEIMKVLETLHRHAHYAPSTYKQAT